MTMRSLRWNLYALESHRYQSQSEYSHHIKPSSPLRLLQGLLYLCAYQRLNSENGIQEEHAVCLNQLSLILKSSGENGKTLSERKINNALLKKLISLTLFLFAKIITDPKKKKRRRRNMRFILVLPWSKGLPSSPSLLWSLTHDLGVVLPCPRLWSTSWETWYLILSRTSVCFLQEVPQASYPTQCSFAYSWSLTDICTNIFL